MTVTHHIDEFFYINPQELLSQKKKKTQKQTKIESKMAYMKGQ